MIPLLLLLLLLLPLFRRTFTIPILRIFIRQRNV